MHEFLASCKFYFRYAFFFSMFVNILQLTFPIYMLQVYDKVLTSYNMSTLVVITLAAVICLVVLACLDWLRSRLLVRAGIEFDQVLSGPVMRENLKKAAGVESGAKQASVRDVQTLRTFLGGNAIFAFFDFPWMPIYILIIFILHPALGMVAVFGGVLVFILGVLTDRLTRKKLDSATALNAHAANFVGAAMRNASLVHAMGMTGAVSSRWENINKSVIELQTRASHNAGLLHAISKSLRIGLQVVIYAVGAYLAITHVSTAGAMIAASIIMGRALAPIDQAMATYKQSLEALGAYKRLKELLDAPPVLPPMEMPAPAGHLTMEGVAFSVQGRAIIKGINFSLPAGQSIAIIGPSAAGKSTLCKLLLGIWPPSLGKVRIDGVDLATWDMEKLGPHIGYLPQDVELFAGTIAENIARMGDVDSQKVLLAAQMAGVHNLILHLPKGYDTQIGEQGVVLSGGQRQRLGLARALYGLPKVVILDEPNSNLDEEGELSLLQALANLKQAQSTVVLVTHKPSVLSVMDNIMVMQDGQVTMCGPRQEILAKLAAMQKQQQEQARQYQEQMAKQQALLRQRELAKNQAAPPESGKDNGRDLRDQGVANE
jgi:type I secretion system ABC transporter, PrtD family